MVSQRFNPPEPQDCSHEIQVDQLLLLQVRSGNVLQHVGKEGRDILAKGHGHDRLLNRLFSVEPSVSPRCS